jgi:anti-sigma-K factor RskA
MAMNNKPDSNDTIRDDFDAWLQADEIPAQPPASFRNRLHEQIATAAVCQVNNVQAKRTSNPTSILSFRWYVSLAAAAAAMVALFIGFQLLQNETPVVESVWLAVEVDLYAAMLESIDSETLTELSELLAYY